MSDPEQCRATAARYARLAEMTGNAEIRRSYYDLERLWLEMAAITDRIDLAGHASLRERLYAMVEAVGQRPQAVH